MELYLTPGATSPNKRRKQTTDTLFSDMAKASSRGDLEIRYPNRADQKAAQRISVDANGKIVRR